MTLTQQFLIVTLFPLSFLGMVVYLWRSELNRRSVAWRWTFTLLGMAVWASSLLRLYGGIAFPQWLVFSWGVVGHYALGLSATGVLLTSLSFFNMLRSRGRLAVGLSLGFWVVALALDPSIWGYQIPNLAVAGRMIRHFDIWGGVWVVSWVLPLLSTFLFTQQINREAPKSIQQNQLRYWLFSLGLFFAGCVFASIQQPGQPIWQQLGLMMILPGAFVGTVTIGRRQLPDLQLALHQILSRLSGTIIVFGLTWLALSVLTRLLNDVPDDASRNLLLVLAAALFAGLFMLAYRLVNEVTRRIFLPAEKKRERVLADYGKMVGNLPDPTQLSQLCLRIVQAVIGVNDGWLFTTEEAPGGKLVLRPLAHLNASPPPEMADFPENSPFTIYVRNNVDPLVQYDIDNLPSFAAMTAEEKETLARWRRVVFVPFQTGDSLIGLLALGGKPGGDSYTQSDYETLVALAEEVSPLLAQAQNLVRLRQINDFVFEQNQVLQREKQHLHSLVSLYSHFVSLISPDLKRPFSDIIQQLDTLQEEVNDTPSLRHVKDLNQHIDALKSPFDKLILTAARLQEREHFDFIPIYINEVAQQAVRNLRTMAEARRVRLELDINISVPAVYGDEEQLLEAVQHLLHNAIKFNKIGGTITLDYGVDGSEIFLHVMDSGVGIPNERIDSVWQKFPGLTDFPNGSKGTGLGLTLSHFIVEAHGGRLDVDSNYGSGSTFSLFLPIAFDVQGSKI